MDIQKELQKFAWKLSRALANPDKRFAYIIIVSDQKEGDLKTVAAGLGSQGVLEILKHQYDFFYHNRDALSALVSPSP